MFLSFINHSTLTTDQRIQATLMQNLFENVHTVREEEATWSGRLPCAFCQSLPFEIPLPQPIIMMPYSIHQNSPSVVSLHSKMSIQKEGTCLVKVKYKMIVKSHLIFMVLCNNLNELRLYFTKKNNKCKTHLSCESST